MTLHIPFDQRERLFDLVHTRTGLMLDANRRKDLAALTKTLLDSGDIADLDALQDLLTNEPIIHPLWQRLIYAITIGETYFFRNSPQFDALRTQVLPELIAQRRQSGHMQLRLWSAGCATGEEPYSLAILLRELLPDIENWSISLLATDINESYLDEARRGIYRNRSFRNETPAAVRQGWFTAVDGGYQISHTIRQMVVFKPLNLTADDFPSFESGTMHMDVILCRNVTIYFDRETTRQVAQRFRRALNSNGWLVVGHAEPQIDLYEGLVVQNFANTTLYRKPIETLPTSYQDDAQIVRRIVPELTHLPKHGASNRLHQPAKPVRRQQKPAVVPEPEEKSETDEDFLSRAKTAADLEQWDKARVWLEKAEAQGRFEPQVYYLRALIALNEGDSEAGLQLLRRAIYCDPSFVLAQYTLGDVFEQRGARKDAVRHWRMAQSILTPMDAHQVVPFSEDLTVEMFNELLAFRLATE